MSHVPREPVTRSRRRFLRFTVRGLIVLVLVVGAGLGWLVRSAHLQRDAVAAIRNARGVANYDWQWRNGKLVPGGMPWAPRWLVDRIGVDYFGHVTVVLIFTSAPATDEAIAHLRHLSRLEQLNLGSSNVDDAGLANLKGLTELLALDLSGTQVTGAGLVHLKGLNKLSYLSLADTNVSDAGLVNLQGLTKLSYVGLARTQVTEAGIKRLKLALPHVTTYP